MIRHSGLLRLFALSSLLLLASGCARFFDREDPLETLPVEQMYEVGKDALRSGNTSRAERYYRRLIARFPFGTYTEQAQLELAYVEFRSAKGEEALSTLNRFIRTYPTHPHIAYAYYLRAVVNFDSGNPLLDRLARIDSTQRDQSSTRQSFNDFAEVIRRFPNTAYAVDARQRMIHVRNQLARNEINVAKYYLRRGAWIAAAKRGQYIIEFYPQSAYQGDALAVMAESYARLGQDTLAEDAIRVLRANDPQHAYFTGDWPQKRAWWRKLIPLGDNSRKG
ncbi:MAG: outer membrane protein assembly factor BamD [Pseudomarimonas sp.]